ncbi:MAG TPA: hypothetical protein VFP47_19230, partial [Pyrinomonadaceae bacterium]|nr:hypothetical protein [Pyrinomonadaceae bacterium]
SRTLIVEYYREEKGLKIEHRREQAMRLNTTLNGLRLRASRIRAELTQCIHSCLGEGSQGSQGSQGNKTRNQPVDTE